MNALPPASFRDFASVRGLNLTSEIVVDSFAGGGGASKGIERALRRLHDMGLLGPGDPSGVNVAINHDDAAIAMHEANHADTLHLHNDIWKVDPLSVTSGYPVGLLWASPDCRHHSKAKGGRPVSASVRDLAWVVAHWADQVKPRMIFLENVEEFRQWGPLIPDGKGGLKPCPARRGKTFARWVRKFRKLGYKVEWRELRACDYGTPTIRKRLYIIMRCDGLPIVWPAPTHGNPDSDAVKAGKLKPWPIAADIIDWDRPCPSIFMDREQARAFHRDTGIRIIRPLARNTMARIAKGVKRYVIDAAEPFMISVNHGYSGGRREYGIDEPLGTVTTQQSRALVTPYFVPRYQERPGQEPRTRPVTLPAATVVPGGNTGSLAQATLAPFSTYGQHGGRSRPADDPLHTVTASKKDTNQVAAVFLAQHNNDSRRLDGVNPGRAADDPVATVTTRGTQIHRVAAYVVRQFGASIGSAATDPVGTVTAGGGGKTQVATAHMISLKGSERRASSMEDPHPAVTAQGQHSGVVMPFMTAYYGSDEIGAAADAPFRTVTGKPRFGHIEASVEAPPLTEAQLEQARAVAAFLREYGCWDGGEFVTVGPYIIVDIGMRMLTPRELALAQGFDEDYVLAAPIEGGTLSETKQRHKIGNSVCPQVAEALVFENFRAIPRKPERPDQGWLFEVAA